MRKPRNKNSKKVNQWLLDEKEYKKQKIKQEK